MCDGVMLKCCVCKIQLQTFHSNKIFRSKSYCLFHQNVIIKIHFFSLFYSSILKECFFYPSRSGLTSRVLRQKTGCMQLEIYSRRAKNENAFPKKPIMFPKWGYLLEMSIELICYLWFI